MAGAMAETERGEQRLLDLLNFGLFTDPLHRLIWQSLPVLAKSAPPDLPRALEAMYHPDAAATELFDRWGGVKSYLDGLMQAGRRDRAAGSAGRKLNVNKHTIARAMSHVVGVAMNRVLDATDPKFDEAFADDRVKLLRDLNSSVREDED